MRKPKDANRARGVVHVTVDGRDLEVKMRQSGISIRTKGTGKPRLARLFDFSELWEAITGNRRPL